MTSPKCLSSLETIFGYTYWKKQEILKATRGDQARLNAALVQHGFYDVDGNKISFLWKEARYKNILKKTYQVKEYYDHFYLDSEFDNDTFSYTVNEVNLDTGVLENVKYEILPPEDGGSIIKAILLALNINNASSLSDLPTVRLPLRVFTVNSGTDPNYLLQVIGRFTGINNTSPLVNVLATTENESFASFDRAWPLSTYALGSDRQYFIDAQDTLTYTQKRNHIITSIECDKTNTFKKIGEKTEKSEFIKLYEYQEVPGTPRFLLKNLYQKQLYTWTDLSNRSASVSVSLGGYKPVYAKVKKTFPDGCKKIYEKVIGKKRRDTYLCTYYSTKTSDWTPSTNPLNQSNCSMNNAFLDNLNQQNLGPGTQQFDDYIDGKIKATIYDDNRRLLPLSNPIRFLGPDPLASYNKPINPNSTEPYVEFGTSANLPTSTDLYWKIYNY